MTVLGLPVVTLVLLAALDVLVPAVHELGHLAAARLLHVDARPGWAWVRLHGLRVGVAPCIRVRADALAGRPVADGLIAVGGPVASVALGAVLLCGSPGAVSWAAGVVSIVFGGVAALVPGYPGSDGRRILRARPRS